LVIGYGPASPDSDGIAATIVNGIVAIENGEATGYSAGRVLKGRLAAR